jgi:hypothetical protein
MPSYYLDIETTGLDPNTDKIITIQYQMIDTRTGKSTGELIILKEWESDERTILERFINDSGITSDNVWSFVPHGFNLGFEHKFLLTRTLKNKLPQIDILNRPFVDLHSVGVLMNGCQFKGASLGALSPKKGSGKDVLPWYQEKNYNAIIDYIEDETKGFLDLFFWLCSKLPSLREEYRKEKGLK